MKYLFRESEEPLYEMKRPPVIEYDRIPKDARPMLKDAPSPPKGLTVAAVIWVAATTLVAVVLAVAILIFSQWSYFATCVCLVAGLVATEYSAISMSCHYLAVLGCNPCLFYKANFEENESERRWFRALTSETIPPIYFWIVVLIALFLTFVAAGIDFGPRLERCGIMANFITAPMVLGLVLAISYYIYRQREAMRPSPRRKMWDESAIALSAYFQPDFDSRIPNAFRSPQGPLPVRVMIFFVGPFLLTLAIGGSSNLYPVGPALMSEDSLANLALDHPYHRSEEFVCPDPEVRKQTQYDLQDFTFAEIIEDGDRLEGEAQFSLFTRGAALKQLDFVKYRRNAWIYASWGHAQNRFFVMIGSWLGSLLFTYLVILSVVGVILFFTLSDLSLRQAVVAKQWLAQQNELDYRTVCQFLSSDPYESESIHLGTIIDLQNEEEI